MAFLGQAFSQQPQDTQSFLDTIAIRFISALLYHEQGFFGTYHGAFSTAYAKGFMNNGSRIGIILGQSSNGANL